MTNRYMYRMHWSLVMFMLLAAAGRTAGAGSRTVDFRYALPWWQTALCLPDDPDKVVVGKEGEFLTDWGFKRGLRNFNVFIQAGVQGGAQWVKQEMDSARVPLLRTLRRAGAVRIEEETFAVIPAPGEAFAPKLTRVGGEKLVTGFDEKETRVLYNWAKPAVPCDPAFRDIAVTTSGLLQYKLTVPAGGKRTVVVGLCEGYYKEPGRRPMDLTVEGAAPRRVDPIREGGPNQPIPYVFDGSDQNKDGVIDIRIAAVPGAPDRAPVCNAIWAFDGELPPLERILKGLENDRAYAFVNCGHDPLPARQYLTILRYSNEGRQTQTLVPQVTAESDGVRCDAERGLLAVGDDTRCFATLAVRRVESVTANRLRASFEPVRLDPGEARTWVLAINRGGRQPAAPVSCEQAESLRNAALLFWNEQAHLPYDVIQVPDPGIQRMLDACVRNIYQARDIKHGQPAFHVGPTVYRCLWAVDGSFLLEAATMLGRGAEARAGINYLMSFQEPDGGFQLKKRFWKENGLVLWAVTRHAFLTQDKAWLRTHWPNLKRVFAHIQALRNCEGAADPHAPEYRLLPWGDIDGGINNTKPNEHKGEYSNVYWSLIGMKAAIQAAHWLDESETAAQWQREYDDFYAAFRQAAQRDLRPDAHGNRYLPIIMRDALQALPQRAQWAFCHAVYPGQLFAPDDPLAAGTLNMLKANECQGLIFNTGWMPDGIWTYFASFYAHALLWQGEGAKAAQVLYDFANHAVPTMVWREEQKPVGQGGTEVGDMPHNWASAEFIRLATHLLELDRGAELHLLEGLPPEWTRPGMVTKLNGVATPFGPLHLELRVARDGSRAHLSVRPLEASCKRVVVHLAGWAAPSAGKVREFAPGQAIECDFPLPGGGRL